LFVNAGKKLANVTFKTQTVRVVVAVFKQSREKRFSAACVPLSKRQEKESATNILSKKMDKQTVNGVVVKGGRKPPLYESFAAWGRKCGTHG